MTEAELPQIIRDKLKELNIPAGLLRFSLESESGINDSPGRSLFLMFRQDALLFSSPPTCDYEMVGRAKLDQIGKVMAAKSFLGDLHIDFLSYTNERLISLNFPGLQSSIWKSVLKTIKDSFPGKYSQEFEDGEIESSSLISIPSDYFSAIESPSISSVFSPLQIVKVDLLKIDSGTAEDVKNINQYHKQSISDEINSSSNATPSTAYDQKNGMSEEIGQPEQYEIKSLDFQQDNNLKPTEKKSEVAKRQAGKTVKCGKCGRENLPHYAYCLGCGLTLEKKGVKKNLLIKTRNTNTDLKPSGVIEVEAHGCLLQLFYISLAIIILFLIKAIFPS